MIDLSLAEAASAGGREAQGLVDAQVEQAIRAAAEAASWSSRRRATRERTSSRTALTCPCSWWCD
ncbi:MAG: hypothetical protein ACRDYA_05225 [Egibacteraceae bacterium]